MNDNEINKIIDNFAISLVGIMCKRIEIIENICKEKSSPELIELFPKIFKALIKELTYENCRVLKQRLAVSSIPTVIYRKGNCG